jgi:hypothetical protein
MKHLNLIITLQEAKELCIILSKVDPHHVFTGDLSKRIGQEAVKVMESKQEGTNDK